MGGPRTIALAPRRPGRPSGRSPASTQLVARRLAGEPLQYVLGHWAFRTLDLLRRPPGADPAAGDRGARRPRARRASTGPARRRRRPRHRLGRDRPVAGGRAPADVEVWATDASADALAVARANLAGHRHARRAAGAPRGGRLVRRPARRPARAAVDWSCRNPPYVADDDPLPAEVRRLGAGRRARRRADGARGDRAHRRRGAALAAAGGTLVVEIGETQEQR